MSSVTEELGVYKQWIKMNYMLLIDTTVLLWLYGIMHWRYSNSHLANRGCHDEWLEVSVLIQLLQLEQRLAELKKEKHGLFSELKKVLHQENEIRQRETERQMKEQKSVQYDRSSLFSLFTAFCWLIVLCSGSCTMEQHLLVWCRYMWTKQSLPVLMDCREPFLVYKSLLCLFVARFFPKIFAIYVVIKLL